MNLFDLTGKHALVIGGRGYLGRRICSVLRDAGANVTSADLPVVSAAAAKSDAALPKDVLQTDVNVTDRASVQAMMQTMKKIDILIYAVTAKPKDFYAPYTRCSLEGWRDIMTTELDGAFLITQEVGKRMEEQESGTIILLSSIYGIVGNDQRIYEGSNLANLYANDAEQVNEVCSHGAYNVAKGGIIALTKYLATYWGRRSIRVNCISMGGIEHPGENEAFVKNYAARTPLGRKARAQEIDGALLYLSSDASSYVTGHNLVVDGGWTAW